MVKMYTLNEEGILQILDIPTNDAILICNNNPCFKYTGLKFLTLEEFKGCSSMDQNQRKLYYELKED